MSKCVFALFLLPALTAWGQDISSESSASPMSVSAMQLEAKSLRDEAAGVRKQAETTHIARKTECYHKFLVNKCLDEAHDVYIETIKQARKLDLKASEFDRRIHIARASERRVQTNDDGAQLQREVQFSQTESKRDQELKELQKHQAEQDARVQQNAQKVEQEAARRSKHDTAVAQDRANKTREANERAEKAIEDKARYEERERALAEKNKTKQP